MYQWGMIIKNRAMTTEDGKSTGKSTGNWIAESEGESTDKERKQREKVDTSTKGERKEKTKSESCEYNQ